MLSDVAAFFSVHRQEHGEKVMQAAGKRLVVLKVETGEGMEDSDASEGVRNALAASVEDVKDDEE